MEVQASWGIQAASIKSKPSKNQELRTKKNLKKRMHIWKLLFSFKGKKVQPLKEVVNLKK